MKLITRGKSYSQKQLIKHQGMKWAVILFGLLFLILAISYFWVVGGYWIHDPQFIVTGVAVLLGALVILLAQRVSNCLDNYLINKDGQIGIAKAGDLGECLVREELDKVLDDSYVVCANYIIPGHKFDLDFLIIGPKGLIVVEVKNFSDSTIFSEQQALRVKDFGYRRETTMLVGKADPRTKIDTHCRVFNNYLNYLGLDNIKIKKVLVFPKDHITIEGKSRIYIVKKIHELGQYFEDLYPDERFTPEFCAEVAYKLFQ